jgi:hypothetical protein
MFKNVNAFRCDQVMAVPYLNHFYLSFWVVILAVKLQLLEILCGHSVLEKKFLVRYIQLL